MAEQVIIDLKEPSAQKHGTDVAFETISTQKFGTDVAFGTIPMKKKGKEVVIGELDNPKTI